MCDCGFEVQNQGLYIFDKFAIRLFFRRNDVRQFA